MAITEASQRSEALTLAVSIIVALNHTQAWFPAKDSLAIVELADQFLRFLQGEDFAGVREAVEA